MRPAWTRPDRLAALLLAAAVAVLCASVVDALRIAPLPAPVTARGADERAPAAADADGDAAAARPAQDPDAAGASDAVTGSATGHALLAAVARDPFRPDRRRAPDRYRLPGEALALERTARRTPVPALRLLGTASYANGGGYAALALQGRAPLLVPVGDTLAGLRLVHVDTGSATLEGADTVLLLQLAREPAPRRRQ